MKQFYYLEWGGFYSKAPPDSHLRLFILFLRALTRAEAPALAYSSIAYFKKTHDKRVFDFLYCRKLNTLNLIN